MVTCPLTLARTSVRCRFSAAGRLRLHQRRLRGQHASDILFMGLGRDHVAQREIAPRRLARHIECCLGAGNVGVGFVERGPVSWTVDYEEQVAGMNDLIVAHMDLGHQTGNIVRDPHDIGADMSVARPGRDLVTMPHCDRDERRDNDDDEGRHQPDQIRNKAFHDMDPKMPLASASAARRRRKIARSTIGRWTMKR